MPERTYVRPLPRAHHVLGWGAVIATPFLTIAALGLCFWALVEWDDDLLALMRASPFGDGSLVTVVTLGLAASMTLPLLLTTRYLGWLRRRFGEARIEDGFVVFHPPLWGLWQAPVAGIERREVTRFGLRVKPPSFAHWLLIPCEGEQAAHAVIATLDQLEHAELAPSAPLEAGEPEPGSLIRVDRRGDGELHLSWPVIRPERVLRVGCIGLALLPVFGLGLLTLPGLLQNGRRRNQLRLTSSGLSLDGVVFAGFRRTLQRDEVDRIRCSCFTIWASVGGRRRDLLDQDALPSADVRRLYRLLQAWQAGQLELGRG